MPVQGNKYTFNEKNIGIAPNEPGVYALYDGDALIYCGSSTKSIRDRLQSHHDGDDGPCTQAASGYRRENCDNGLQRERELLQAYKNHNGALPRCNDVIP